jgi:hypothetical protein
MKPYYNSEIKLSEIPEWISQPKNIALVAAIVLFLIGCHYFPFISDSTALRIVDVYKGVPHLEGVWVISQPSLFAPDSIIFYSDRSADINWGMGVSTDRFRKYWVTKRYINLENGAEKVSLEYKFVDGNLIIVIDDGEWVYRHN